MASQPGKKGFSLCRALKIVKAQFERARLTQSQADLRDHFARRLGGHNSAHSILTKETHP
jgi:hypothetical protein